MLTGRGCAAKRSLQCIWKRLPLALASIGESDAEIINSMSFSMPWLSSSLYAFSAICADPSGRVVLPLSVLSKAFQTCLPDTLYKVNLMAAPEHDSKEIALPEVEDY